MHRPASGGSEGQITSASSDVILNRVMVEPDTIPEQIHGKRISLLDGWSSLHYVDVEVEGLSRPLVALNDSGAQVCCIRADVISTLELPKLGQVCLRGVVSDVLSGDVVRLNVKLCGGRLMVPITAAVCDTMNCQLITLILYCISSNTTDYSAGYHFGVTFCGTRYNIAS